MAVSDAREDSASTGIGGDQAVGAENYDAGAVYIY